LELRWPASKFSTRSDFARGIEAVETAVVAPMALVFTSVATIELGEMQ